MNRQRQFSDPQKVPIDRKTLRSKFPSRNFSLKKTHTIAGEPAIRLVVEGVPRGASRDPNLTQLYEVIDNIKQSCTYAGKPILY